MRENQAVFGCQIVKITCSNPELFAQIREKWKGPFYFGAPDMVVVNMTSDKIWVRGSAIPEYPNIAAAKFDAKSQGGLVIPSAKYNRSDIQQKSIRNADIPPKKYYPEGYAPETITEWSADKPPFIPAEMMK